MQWGVPAYDAGWIANEAGVVTDGLLSSYVLSLSANRLGLDDAMLVECAIYSKGKGFEELVSDMGRGLIVTELMGWGLIW